MEKIKNAGRKALAVLALSLLAYAAHAQVGIGTTTPQAKLHVHDGSMIGTISELPAQNDPFYDPDIPTPIQYGFRWYHAKCALRSVAQRVGQVGLDPLGMGLFSFASGYETLALGYGATALGMRTTASGDGSLAVGYGSNAAGNWSLASGYSANASGGISVALGEQVSTNAKYLSFAFGSATSKVLQNDADRQMVMGFSGGYKFYTNSNATIGIQLTSGSNAWSVISDVNKKENFAPVNGEEFLQKISKMNLTSWNYKGQDPKTFRHYGPMAQDFYKAFGRDTYGTIGTDTTINQADFDGINLIAIQALVRKMEQMNSDLLAEIATIKAQLADAQSALRRKNRREFVSKR